MCQIHHHYEPAASCEAPPVVPVLPNITINADMSKAVADAEYPEKLNTIKKILRGTPLPAKQIPLAVRPGLR